MVTPPPDTSFWIPGNIFEYVVAAFMSVLAWLFKRHLRDDDAHNAEVNKRFELQEAIIERRHAENQVSREILRSEMANGNRDLMTQMGANRREIIDVLLQMSAQMRGGTGK